MLLTVTTIHSPATDMGLPLAKPGGRAWINMSNAPPMMTGALAAGAVGPVRPRPRQFGAEAAAWKSNSPKKGRLTSSATCTAVTSCGLVFVVAHARLREEMHGRGSGRRTLAVRAPRCYDRSFTSA